MSDIVSWLRNSAIVRSDDLALSGRYTEAADEIEWLQEDNRVLREQCRKHIKEVVLLRRALEDKT